MKQTALQMAEETSERPWSIVWRTWPLLQMEMLNTQCSAPECEFDRRRGLVGKFSLLPRKPQSSWFWLDGERNRCGTSRAYYRLYPLMSVEETSTLSIPTTGAAETGGSLESMTLKRARANIHIHICIHIHHIHICIHACRHTYT